MTKHRARAVVVLFLAGYSLRQVARLLRVSYADAVTELRRHTRGRNW